MKCNALPWKSIYRSYERLTSKVAPLFGDNSFAKVAGVHSNCRNHAMSPLYANGIQSLQYELLKSPYAEIVGTASYFIKVVRTNENAMMSDWNVQWVCVKLFKSFVRTIEIALPILATTKICLGLLLRALLKKESNGHKLCVCCFVMSRFDRTLCSAALIPTITNQTPLARPNLSTCT
jgi:hypothetical protein